MQSHFVKLEPPYQIIHYGGVVGIQIGTLIVVSENSDDPSGLGICTRSHPVVSYVDKIRLRDVMKDDSNDHKLSYYAGGEGSVWSKVEVNDVDIVGLWDPDTEYDKPQFDWDHFAGLVLDGFSSLDSWNGTYRENGIYDLMDYLRRVGLAPVRPCGVEKIHLDMWYNQSKSEHNAVDKIILFNNDQAPEGESVGFAIPCFEGDMDKTIEIATSYMDDYLSLMRSYEAEIEFSACVYESDDERAAGEYLKTLAQRLNDLFKTRKAQITV